MKLFLWEQEEKLEISEKLLEPFLMAFPEPVRRELQKTKDTEKKLQRVCAWQLLSFAVRQKEVPVTLEQMKICRTEKGKPYSTSQQDCYFSLSHCSEACACILSETQAGVDVERRICWNERLAGKVCHPREWELLETYAEKEKKEQIFGWLWSLKEAAVKLEGSGLSYGLCRLDFSSLLREEGEERKEQIPVVRYALTVSKEGQALQFVPQKEERLLFHGGEWEMPGTGTVKAAVCQNDRYTLAAVWKKEKR